MRVFKEILLVEDDPIFQLVAQKMLEKHGVAEQVVVTTHGRQALDYLIDRGLLNKELDSPPWLGLVLLDINMPVMNGFEFLEALQAFDAQDFIGSKVVMLTSSGNAADKQNAQRFGVKAYLEKPLTVEHLRAVL